MPGCLTIWPLPECGAFGTCIKPENGTEFCECRDGFSQTLEMQFFVDPENIDTSLCIYHKITVQTMWSLTLVILILVTIFGWFAIESWKKAKELSLWFAITGVSFSCSLYRVLEPDRALLGVDFTFSFLVSMAYTLFFIFTYRKFVDSFEYISKKASSVSLVATSTFIQRSDQIIKLHFVTSIGVLITSQSFWIATLTSREISAVIFRTFWGYLFFHFATAAMFTYLTYYECEKDMKGLLEARNDQSGFSIHRAENVIATIKEYLPNIRLLRRMLTTIHLTWALMSILIVFDLWLVLWTYLLPIVSVQVSSFGLAFILYNLSIAHKCGTRMTTSVGNNRIAPKAISELDVSEIDSTHKTRTGFQSFSAKSTDQEIESAL